jgi:uncharacterized OsmC-like protein
MGIVPAELKTVCEKMIEVLSSAEDPLRTRGTVRADVRVVGNQVSESKVRTFVLVSGEPESVGGKNEGPNPLEFFMSSIAFCENVTFQRNAALMGVDVDSLETTVRGYFDRKGQWEIGGAEPSFKEIIVETKVNSKEAPERIKELVRLAHRRCPMHAMIVKATKVVDKLTINGKEDSL